MAQAEVLVTGLYFGEGPRWHDGRLWFSDFYDHAVKTVTLDGDLEIAVDLGEGQPSGLGWLPDGRLLIVSMLDRRVLRREADGSLVEHADLAQIASYHCNDMVVDRLGRAYVGNFGFDLDAYIAEHGVEGALAEPGPPRAVLTRIDPDGTVQVVADGLKFPNGTVITPDGSTLVIAETLGLCLTAFDIAEDGSLDNRRSWAELGFHAPDGICLDADGNIWVANPLAPECVLYAPGGTALERVETGEPCFACMLGGPDRKHLFMLTARSSAAHLASQERTGAVEVLEVATAGDGLP
jgi:sugar lactone lactonase YvrE